MGFPLGRALALGAVRVQVGFRWGELEGAHRIPGPEEEPVRVSEWREAFYIISNARAVGPRAGG